MPVGHFTVQQSAFNEHYSGVSACVYSQKALYNLLTGNQIRNRIMIVLAILLIILSLFSFELINDSRR